jgi:signal transduction histidine kinase
MPAAAGNAAASGPEAATPFKPVKTASRYIVQGLLYGAAVGVVAGHPLFMAAHHLHDYFGGQVPLRVAQTILRSFSYHAWPLILFFAVTGGVVGALWGRLRYRLEAHRLDYHARLRALAAEISLSEERERHRLATELHEHVGQILSVAQIKLGALTPEVKSPPGLAALQEARDHVETSIRYIRSLTGELSPPVLYEMGFAPAVVWLARQIRDQQGIEVELQQHPIPWPPCNDSQILLFIIFRDLLTYLVNQTRPRALKIVMQTEAQKLHLQVEHDGVEEGDTGGDPPGFALFSIRERLDRIGGTVARQARSDRGAVITLKVPLRREVG